MCADWVCSSALSTNGQDGHEPRLRPEARSREPGLHRITLAAAERGGINTRNSTGTVQAVIQADLVYATVGGLTLRLDLYTPSGARSRLPTLLYLHGGAWTLGDKSDAVAERLMPIVANGFAVASVNYRLVPSVRCPAPVHDVRAAVRWLRANAAEYGLDPDRIAIGGVSAGGHLASLTALTAGDAQLEGDVGNHVGVSSAVSAVIAYYPTSDFLLSGGRNALETQILPPPETAALLGLDRIDDDPDLARSASPRHRVHAGAPPHLILHGDRDAMVNRSVAETARLSTERSRSGISRDLGSSG
jgi:acetyl esterase/lipase